MLVAEGRYWLFYTAVPEPFYNSGPNITKTAIGIAVADSPAGPFKRIDANPVLTATEDPDLFDSMRVDDACLIVRDGKYWLYYKGRQWNNTPGNTKMGLAIADKPRGPYKRVSDEPLIPGGHEVVVWSYGEGVVAMINRVGPKNVRNTLQYAADGIHFSKLCDLPRTPHAAGPYRPEAFTDSGEGRMIQWGLQISGKRGGLPFLTRFDFAW